MFLQFLPLMVGLIVHILNSVYNDAGATATDETDGNISSNIYIDNQVNEDKIGEYPVTYRVVDQAGNEANPITRWVSVYNEGYIYSGNYSLQETRVYPSNTAVNTILLPMLIQP